MPHVTRILVVAVILLAFSAGVSGEDASYVQGIRDWQARREAGLRKPDGWLALVGLWWLPEGNHSVGSDPSCDCPLPADRAPLRVATLRREGDRVVLEVLPGVDVRCRGERITRLVVDAKEEEGTTVCTLGSLSWYVIRREDRIGIRVKDSQSPTLTAFQGMEYYPIDPKWRLVGRFEPYRPPRRMHVPTARGYLATVEVPGAVVFDAAGRTHRLDAFAEDDQLMIVFGDATNGRGTYPAGRFLMADRPDAAGRVVLDFNRAYSPPCSFTPYATCSLPPEQNRLDIAIDAGEKGSGH